MLLYNHTQTYSRLCHTPYALFMYYQSLCVPIHPSYLHSRRYITYPFILFTLSSIANSASTHIHTCSFDKQMLQTYFPLFYR